jgi:2'-5' RNA ligase
MVARVRDAVAGLPPSRLATTGLGAFPGRSRARVLWLGISDPDKRLADLASAVRSAAGADPGEPFRPHVTLARSRDRGGAIIPSPRQDAPIGTINVTDVRLMRSHLGVGPARYQELARAALTRGGVAVATP